MNPHRTNICPIQERQIRPENTHSLSAIALRVAAKPMTLLVALTTGLCITPGSVLAGDGTPVSSVTTQRTPGVPSGPFVIDGNLSLIHI